MPKATVDGIEVEFEPGMTVLQVCELAGKEIPRFCYHERLSIAGNCRMCLVEIEGGPPKPAASCALGCAPDMKIHTNTPMVKKAREGVMEFLLINHPLDCPICDQGGECDLQDQAMAYGMDNSRYQENKRAVEDKHMGPLIKTIMTRCIHCTRCVRFGTEVAGIEELGSIGRGEDTEITTYLEQAVSSELSGNVIDLCPVGALTSKPYAFMARPWELRKTESIDVTDAIGASIRVDARGAQVMRVMPRNHDEVNEEWITDKARFIWDGLNRQRLDQPYLRKDGKLTPVDWDEALGAAAAALRQAAPERVGALAGDLVSTEAVFALKSLMTGLGISHLDCLPLDQGARLGAEGAERASYLFNTTIAGVEAADAILLIGANPRWEAALVNTRIRKTWLATGLPIGVIGEQRDLTYDYAYLGAGPRSLEALLSGGDFLEVLKKADRPLIILGEGALRRSDGAAVLRLAADLAAQVGAIKGPVEPVDGEGETVPGWNGFNILHSAAARVGALDVGFVPGENGLTAGGMAEAAAQGKLDVAYLLGVDEGDLSAFKSSFVIYQGSHGDQGASMADVILPGAAFTEQDGLYVNLEGRVQLANRAHFPPGQAKEDWAILRALSGHLTDKLGGPLPFDSHEAARQALLTAHPVLGEVDYAAFASPLDLSQLGQSGPVSEAPFVSPIKDFYLTNPIARASQVLADCSKLYGAQAGAGAGTGTDG